MRLLPARPNQAGGRTPQANAQANRRADHRGHERQYLQLRHISADSHGDQNGSGGNLMTTIVKMNRRELMKGAALASGFVLGFELANREFPFAEAATRTDFAPNLFVDIDASGLITIVAHRSEMGTGIRTSLPMI